MTEPEKVEESCRLMWVAMVSIARLKEHSKNPVYSHVYSSVWESWNELYQRLDCKDKPQPKKIEEIEESIWTARLAIDCRLNAMCDSDDPVKVYSLLRSVTKWVQVNRNLKDEIRRCRRATQKGKRS